jgi:hypothetical protein
LGDRSGVRTSLDNDGSYLSLDATAEFARNPIGGLKQGSTSANQIALLCPWEGSGERADIGSS